MTGRPGCRRGAGSRRRPAASRNGGPCCETTPARNQRYQELLIVALPPAYQQQPDHQAKWLWRTLRAAELAGLDARQVLTDAIGERDLTGACDIYSVIDARIRRRTATLVPLTAPVWSAQLPDLADPERRGFVAEIAALMDARKQRIGEYAAASSLLWAVIALGPVPGNPATRLDWQQRAASIGAYRELSGYDHPADPIGPEPSASTPDLRAAWHEAFAALGPADGPDVRGMPGGDTAAPARHLSHRNRLGAPMDRQRTPALPQRRPRRPPGRAPRHRRSDRR
jgi:hypothetical protein